MIVRCIVNGKEVEKRVAPHETLRSMLLSLGHFAVRDSDDGEGFVGSDTVIFNDRPIYSNLMLAAEAGGGNIRTPDSLAQGAQLNVVQEAMIDAGVVQSAYNAPAAALLLTWLLERKPNATRADVAEVLSGIFIRDAGYEHYYLAVELAKEKMKSGQYSSTIAPEFREHLKYVGKVKPKVDGRQ